MEVILLPPERAQGVVSVLCEAFHDYPVMRYVMGAQADYDRRLRAFVDVAVAVRMAHADPMFGIDDAPGSLVAAATVTLPDEGPPPNELVARREALWAELGADARARYEEYGEVSRGLLKLPRHHHLHMIGVRRAHTGRGFARRLVEAVEDLANEDPNSAGVSLTTEKEENVAFYRHLGYQLIGQAHVGSVDTWGFFRPRSR